MRDLLRKLEKHWGYGLGRTVLAAVCAHSVSISIGVCQAYSAILLPQLQTSSFDDTEIEITTEQASWLASFGAVTNPVGAILSGLLAEWFGRKKAMQFSSVPFLTGWICIGLAEDVTLLYAGRLITGIAAGMATASYTYVTEISTPSTRGVFQALGPISASFGILLTYTLGYFLHWKVVSLISCSFAFFTLVTVQLLPESPCYLHHANRKEAAFKSLTWFRRNVAVAQDEFAAIKLNCDDGNRKEFFSILVKNSTLKPLAILLALFFLQELSGIYAILFYAVDFFRDAQVDFDEHVSSIIVGAIRFVMSIFAAILIHRFGRKSLCTVSSLGMSLSMLGIVAYFEYFDLAGEERRWPGVPLFCVVANVFSSMIGMLPIPWILVGEFFATEARSVMGGVVICVAQIFIFLSVKFYPTAVHKIGFGGTCSVFFCASVLALAFSWFVLPETKNMSLEEIEGEMKGKRAGDGGGVDNRGFVASDVSLGRDQRADAIYTIQVT